MQGNWAFKQLVSLQLQTLRNGQRPARKVGTDFNRLLRALIGQCGVTKSIEIGAFEASFSRWAAKSNPHLNAVIAYEANPYVHARYVDEVRAAGVDYRHACVAGQTGTVGINIPLDHRGSARDKVNQMASLQTSLHAENTEKVQVRSVALDDDIGLTAQDRLALWIDVEGATEIVLSGAEKALRSTAVLQIEVETVPSWKNQWLDHDVTRHLETFGLVPLTRDIARGRQYNLIFVREDFAAKRDIRTMAENYLFARGRFGPATAPVKA